jgi:hypothetical protein
VKCSRLSEKELKKAIKMINWKALVTDHTNFLA